MVGVRGRLARPFLCPRTRRDVFASARISRVAERLGIATLAPQIRPRRERGRFDRIRFSPERGSPRPSNPSCPYFAEAKMNEATLALLSKRRSVAPHLLGEPGPDPAELEALLTLAARVPDHGKLVPWRFILLTGEARHRIGEAIVAA